MTELDQYYKLQKDSNNQQPYFKLLKKLSNNTTSREFFSTANGQMEPQRKQLHNNIIDQYLGKYPAQTKPYIHFILGSIGSGKTSLKDKVTQEKEVKSFLYINFDELKKQLPEYDILKKLNPKKAAHFVQSESAKLAGTLYSKAIKNKINIIYEKNVRLNKDRKLHLTSEIKTAFKKQYQVTLQVVFLDSLKTAWERVQLRYEKIKRHVPKKEVFDTFNSLFPNLNKLLNTQFKTQSPVKIWVWYNGPLELESEKKAHLIGLIGFNGPHKNLEQLYDQFKAENMMIANKTVDFFAGFIHYRLTCLPKSAKKNLLQMDCLKKILEQSDK